MSALVDRISLRNTWPLLLFLLVLPGVSFFLQFGLPTTHDGFTHLWRIARLDEYIRSGMLYPRWMPEMLLGFGYPVLNYYASSTYYLVEFLHLLGLDLYHAFIAAQWLLLYLAAIGMYLLARDVYRGKQLLPPLVASVVYAYGPYLIINMYVRGAIAELGAQMLWPFILWSFRRIWYSDQPRTYVLIAAASLGVLALTHTISLLVVPPFLVLYMLVLVKGSTTWKNRAGWSVMAIAAAMAVSAFYWIPLIFERRYITQVGMLISTTLMLPRSFYSLSDFFDPHLIYRYPGDPLWAIGAVQVMCVLIGLPFAIRESREWRFWLGVLLICFLMMTEAAKPIWLSNDILPIIQFPWRLLAVIQLPVALLCGLPITHVPNRLIRAGISLIVISTVIWVHLPRIQWEYLLSPTDSRFTMAANTYFDARRGQIVAGELGHAAVQEFRPKWTSESLQLDPSTIVSEPGDKDASPPEISLFAGNHFAVKLATSSSEPFALRLTSYYFPGWRAILDGSTSLRSYPSTNLGLLTVDIPPGQHTLVVEWTDTAIVFWATILSQFALLILAIWQFRQPARQRWWALIPLALLVLSLVGSYVRPALQPIHAVDDALQARGIRLLGYRGPQLTEDGIQIYPYWYATETRPAPVRLRWKIRSETGEIVQETVSDLLYDSYSTEHLAQDTLLDDAHLIPLPSSLPVGTYELIMTALAGSSGEELFITEMGAVQVTQEVEPVTPSHPLEVYFGDEIVLVGYDSRMIKHPFRRRLRQDGRQSFDSVQAGDSLEYTLYWRTKAETNEPYVGFIHLVDRLGRPIVQQDQSPGPLLQPVGIWTTYGTYLDRYLLEIPSQSESGIYWPHVGMYNWKDEHRFDVSGPSAQAIGDHFELPAIKVVNPRLKPLGNRVGARFGNLAELVSYRAITDASNVPVEELTVHSGDTLTLTLYSKAIEPTERSVKRFVQVRDENNTVVAQADGEPQDGRNPTWSWIPGEIVRDTLYLVLPEETMSGVFTVYVGYYDPDDVTRRLAVIDDSGVPQANDELALTEILIEAEEEQLRRPASP